MIALEPRAAGAFLQRLGEAWRAAYGAPQAILVVSAHTAARAPVLLSATRHEAVYDFGPFDPRLFTLRYDAAGAPALADRVAALLDAAGQPVHRLAQGGLDHGIWTVLRYLFPAADVPVLPLAYVPTAAPDAQWALGEALAPLRRAGVLVLGSGSITHNLRRALDDGLRSAADRPEIAESAAFRRWFLERSAARDWPALLDYRRLAPHAADMHPTDEHLLPWYVAAGAGGRDTAPQRLHASVTHGSLGMDVYAFGDGQAALLAALGEAATEPA